MAFVKVNKSAMGSSMHVDEIRIGWHIQSEKNKTRSIYLSMSRDVVEKAGWPINDTVATETGSVRIGTRIAVHEGTGSDAGFLMIEYDEHGYSFGSTRSDPRSNAALTVNISITRFKHYAINDILEEKEPQPVEFTIDEKEQTVLIQVPDWLRYNPQSVPQPEPAPVKVEKKDPRPTMTVVPKEEDAEPLRLNREERRRLAKKVASRLGR